MIFAVACFTECFTEKFSHNSNIQDLQSDKCEWQVFYLSDQINTCNNDCNIF